MVACPSQVIFPDHRLTSFFLSPEPRAYVLSRSHYGCNMLEDRCEAFPNLLSIRVYRTSLVRGSRKVSSLPKQT